MGDSTGSERVARFVSSDSYASLGDTIAKAFENSSGLRAILENPLHDSVRAALEKIGDQHRYLSELYEKASGLNRVLYPDGENLSSFGALKNYDKWKLGSGASAMQAALGFSTGAVGIAMGLANSNPSLYHAVQGYSVDSAIFKFSDFIKIHDYVQKEFGKTSDELEVTTFDLLPASELLLPDNQLETKSNLILPPPGIITSIRSIIQKIYGDYREIYSIEPDEFEKVIKELLESKNYIVEQTKRTRDGGRDLIALRSEEMMPDMKFLVECKRWADKVDVTIVRQLMAVSEREGANGAMIFTTSSFTKDAVQEKDDFYKHKLSLHDGKVVMDWVANYCKTI